MSKISGKRKDFVVSLELVGMRKKCTKTFVDRNEATLCKKMSGEKSGSKVFVTSEFVTSTRTITRTHAYTHSRTHLHTHAHTHMHTHTHTHSHAHAHTCTHTHTHTHIHTHAHKHTNTQTHKHTHFHTSTHAHAFTRTRTLSHSPPSRSPLSLSLSLCLFLFFSRALALCPSYAHTHTQTHTHMYMHSFVCPSDTVSWQGLTLDFDVLLEQAKEHLQTGDLRGEHMLKCGLQRHDVGAVRGDKPMWPFFRIILISRGPFSEPWHLQTLVIGLGTMVL